MEDLTKMPKGDENIQGNNSIEETNDENTDETSVNTENIVNEESVEEMQNKPELISETEAVDETIAETKEEKTEATPATNSVEEVQEEDAEQEEINENFLTYTRDQLAEALDIIVKEDISSIKNKVSLVKMAFYTHTNEMKKTIYENFIAEGGLKENFVHIADELEERFKKTLDGYRVKRQKHLEELERISQENLKKKLQIIEELKELINSEETLKKTYDEFKVLQDRWKEIGAVPRNEVNELWKNYHFLIEKFFDKVKINKELKMLDLKKNLDQKIELCEKVEELLLETSVNESFKKLQMYREKWREIGPVPSEKNEEIWERFRTAAEQIDKIRKEYYDNIAEELNQNQLAKTALCEKAEEVLTHNITTLADWDKYTVEVNDLLKVWKTIGQAPRAVNNDLWNRFKTALDVFYANKKEFFDKLKEEQEHNYNLKVNICAQAEEISTRTDWKRATEELLTLQKEWKEIGIISRKASEKLWTRFRAACDIFFAKKEEYFSTIKGIETENLVKKEDILKRLKEHPFTEDRNENLTVIKEFQREWMEIGHVPMSEKNRLQNEFRTFINELFDRLKISAQEVQKQNFINRLSNIDAKDIGRIVSKERFDIQEKIQKLKENLKLWENNLGFLANSKQADILKKEFDKKMQSARQEIALLETKLKILLQTKSEKSTAKEEKPAKKETPKTDLVDNTERISPLNEDENAADTATSSES